MLQDVIDNPILKNQVIAFGGSFTSGVLEYMHKFKVKHAIDYGLSIPTELGVFYKYFNKTFVFIGEDNHMIGALDSDATYEEIEQMIGRSLASYEGIYLRKNIENIILTEPSISIDLNNIFTIPDNIEPEISIYSNSDPYIVTPNISGRDLVINKTEFVGVSKIYVQIKVPNKDIMFTTSFHVFNSDNNNEDFEYTNLTDSPYPWENLGKYWEITDSEYFTGSYSLVSPEVADEDSSSITFTTQLDKPGYVSFAYRTSTEAYGDYLSFSIDGIEMENMETYSLKWAGENDWRAVFYNVRPGIRTFKWTYHKNYVSAHGDDKVWIDSIVLPGSANLTSIDGDFTMNNMELRNFPNPFNPTTKIEFYLEADQNIRLNVFDLQGRIVKTLFDGHIKAGYNSFNFDAENLSNGVYYAVLRTSHQQEITKMILIK